MLTRALKFVTSTSLFLASMSALIVTFSCLLYGVAISPVLLLIGFLAVFSVYGLNKATDVAEDSINRPEMTSKNSNYYLISSVAALLISLILSALQSFLTLLIVAAPLLIGVIYSVKFSPSIPRLKEITGVKSLAVAFSWALTGSLLPITIQSVAWEKVLIVFVYIFTQSFVNTILFDTLDMAGDKFSGVKTIPVALGKEKTRNLLLAINSSLCLLIIYCVINGLFVGFIPSLVFGVFYSYGIIWLFINKTGKRFYADLLVDGEWISFVMVLRLFLR